MTIQLPDDVRAQAEKQAAASGYASVEEYVTQLIREDAEDYQYPDLPPGPNTVRNREDLERLLAEGMDGEVKTMDESFWAERRRRLLDIAARQEGKKT